MFDGPDYELVWPRDLFVAEARALIDSGYGTNDVRVEWLLEEAFISCTPKEDYTAAHKSRSALADDDPWAVYPPKGSQAPAVITKSEFLEELVKRADKLREASHPRPYWHERTGAVLATAGPVVTVDALKRRFDVLIATLRQNGYLERVFPSECVDDHNYVFVDESVKIEQITGIPDLWPFKPADWSDDTLFTLIEVFHDLVARPRERVYHSWNDCGWHYSVFSPTPARALYRFRINELLQSGNVPLRLADQGEDTGRLVSLVDDDRSELIRRALNSPDPKTRDHVQHAIALFRGRTSSVQDKRSAVVALAHFLERRRALLKKELFRGDEGALFYIANEFAIRHEAERQKADYDPVFLDWVFWWYLATVELTDRLIERTNPTGSKAS